MRLVAYLRVSTIEQKARGFGLEVQRRAIRDAAKALDAHIVGWQADEGLSGALPADKRPGLEAALAMIDNGDADGLIVRDLDRLAREVTVQEAVIGRVWMVEHAAVYVSLPPQEVPRDDPDDPMRTAMRQMAGVFAGLERMLVAKRLPDGRRAKAAAGGHATGATPYGWRSAKRSADNPSGALVPVRAEQAALARMTELRAAGASTRTIAMTLTAEGHPTKRGGSWSSATLSRILARETSDAATQQESHATKGDRMYGVWQSGELFWKGQQPWYVSASLSKLEQWAVDNIQHDGQKPFYFVESVGAGREWRDEDLTCLGQLRKDGIRNNASNAKLAGYVASRKAAIREGCPKLTDDQRARRAINIDAIERD
jgi:DNA invertase Pin-like site-specific DNA recombinase